MSQGAALLVKGVINIKNRPESPWSSGLLVTKDICDSILDIKIRQDHLVPRI